LFFAVSGLERFEGFGDGFGFGSGCVSHCGRLEGGNIVGGNIGKDCECNVCDYVKIDSGVVGKTRASLALVGVRFRRSSSSYSFPSSLLRSPPQATKDCSIEYRTPSLRYAARSKKVVRLLHRIVLGADMLVMYTRR
jgi:hypothetical protein